MVLGSNPKKWIFMMLCYTKLELIVSAFIYPGTCKEFLLQIVYGLYPKCTYIFSCPAELRKVVARALVGPEYLSSFIDQL